MGTKALVGDPIVTIIAATVDTADGRPAARVTMVDIGGGEQVVTVDGQQEVRVHPSSRVFHVQLLSPDRMLPDVLRSVESLEEGIALGQKYAVKLAEHALQVDQLADNLKM